MRNSASNLLSRGALCFARFHKNFQNCGGPRLLEFAVPGAISLQRLVFERKNRSHDIALKVLKAFHHLHEWGTEFWIEPRVMNELRNSVAG
ncbi:hypothetical protein C5688_03335 [Methylocystis sp. MitZ-2018]|nr:hypothetical protein C5688_03335 [Methylocystis sp. MitZ-2018]